MAAPSMSVSMANHWNSWFNFHSGKQASSTLLEANVAAQSAGMDGYRSVPGEADGQSNDGQSISGASRLSAASTTSPLRASFADQQQQPLEQMCAHSAYTSPALSGPATFCQLLIAASPLRRFFVPSRDDLARDELEAVMAAGGEDVGEDEDEDVMFQDEEDHDEEASLRAWMRLQQEAARKTWGVKGDMLGLAEYRRQQVLRWQHAQHAHDDEMLDLAFSQLLTRASSSFEGLFYSPPAPNVKLGGAESPPRVRPVRTHGWIDL